MFCYLGQIHSWSHFLQEMHPTKKTQRWCNMPTLTISSMFLTTFGKSQNKKAMLCKALGVQAQFNTPVCAFTCVHLLWSKFEQRLSSQSNVTQKVSEDQLGNSLPKPARIKQDDELHKWFNRFLLSLSPLMLYVANIELPKGFCELRDTEAWVHSLYITLPGTAQTQPGYTHKGTFLP